MKPVFTGAILAVTLTTVGAMAQAEEVCMPASEMKSALIDWYGEAPVPGQAKGNSQLWASDTGGTWTLVKTMADGNACGIAQGQDRQAGREGDRQVGCRSRIHS